MRSRGCRDADRDRTETTTPRATDVKRTSQRAVLKTQKSTFSRALEPIGVPNLSSHRNSVSDDYGAWVPVKNAARDWLNAHATELATAVGSVIAQTMPTQR